MGEKTLNEYFYKPAYKDKGVVEMNKFDAALDVADAEIKANKDARHTQGTDYSNIVICANYDHPDDAITAISTDNKTLLVTEAETCDLSFTVPANVTVRFERGGKWTIATGIIVTFNGQIDAGLWQIFALTGTGTVVLNSGSCGEVYPEWWGAKGDGTTDDAAIFNSVLTQLNASAVKTMVLNKAEYKITDTLIVYAGISIIGRNKYPVSSQFVAQNAATKIIFAPTSEKDLFDITQNTDTSYVPKVYIGNLQLYGNTTGGVTFSKYAINSKAAQSVFENLSITRFQDGIYCNYTMTNKYRDIYIGLCSHACIYTSTFTSTSDIFDNVIMRESPWGAILQNAIDFRFINCLFETLSVGGVNIYRKCATVEFIYCYGENIPSTADGDDYGMFYVNHDGTPLYSSTITIIGGRYTPNAEGWGSFLDVNYTDAGKKVSIIGTSIGGYSNAMVGDSVNTTDYTVSTLGIVYSGGGALYTNIIPVIGFAANTSAELAGLINDETGSGKLVFGTSPTLITPILGVAGATSINFGDDPLSAYKEGEWTPVGVLTTPGDSSSGYQVGRYQRIGNRVFITGTLGFTKGTGTGNFTITGLPYTSENVANGFTNLSIHTYMMGAANEIPTAVIGINTNVITINMQPLGTGAHTPATDTDFSANTGYIRISGSYVIQ